VLRSSLRLVLGLIAGLLVAIPAAPAVAADGVGAATLDGRALHLSQGWGNARSCVVFSAADTRCFASNEEADAAVGYTRERDPLVAKMAATDGAVAAAAIPACASGWLCLYEHINGGGRRLIFQSGYWQNLAKWGFEYQTSSWRNNQYWGDWGYLRTSRGTLKLSPGTYASQMGWYNDTATMVQG
jgi:hypothetical protein